MLGTFPEERLQLLEGIDPEQLPHRDHRSLGHPLDGLGVDGGFGLGRGEVRGQEVLELARGDPPALQVLMVEAEGPLDDLAETPADLLSAFARIAFRPDDAELGHARASRVVRRHAQAKFGQRSRAPLLPTGPGLTSRPLTPIEAPECRPRSPDFQVPWQAHATGFLARHYRPAARLGLRRPLREGRAA